MDTPILLAFGLYFAILLCIGLMAHRSHTTAADFMVGGRKLNYWVTALSAHASDMSSWLFMAFPMKVFVDGLSGLWIAVGVVGGMFLSWQLIAPRLRVATEAHNSYTLNSYIESRVGDTTGVLRLVGAVATLLFTTFYLAAGLTALGFLFESLFGLNYYAGLTIASAVVLAYTTFGGFVSVAYTDFFQAIFLIVMIVIVPICGYFGIERMDTVWEAVGNRAGQTTVLEGIILATAWGLGYFGMPHILTKFMGIRDPKEIFKAKWLGMTWQFISLAAAAAVGIIAMGLYTPGEINDQLVFVEMVKQFLSPFLGGLVLCGVLAATISTMDSQILVVSSTIAEDLYKKGWNRNANSKQVLFASRLSVVGTTLISLAIAFYRDQTIYETVFYAWSGLGCTFGPVLILALLGKSLTRQGALTAMIIGAATSALWPTFGWAFLPTMIPGFSAGLASGWLVSQTTQKK